MDSLRHSGMRRSPAAHVSERQGSVPERGQKLRTGGKDAGQQPVQSLSNGHGKTQTIPTSIYYAVVVGKDDEAMTLVVVMVVFSFALVFGLNLWLKRRNKKGGW